MKVTSVIILFLFVKARASFFDDFKGAMSSVESSFGKLLNDVVADVKTTVHCTILAMEQVLALNGVMEKPMPNKECSNENLDSDHKFSSEKHIVREIHNSISNVNKTLSHILDNKGHERLEHVKKVLKNESHRLTEVSFLLRKELEKISQRLKKKFQNLDFNSSISSLESVRKNMKLLYDAEKNDKTISEEIGKVLNDAMDVLDIKKNKKSVSDEEKINVILKELEQEGTNNNVRNNTIDLKPLKSKSICNSSKPIAAVNVNSNEKVQKEVYNAINHVSHKSSTVQNNKPLSKKDHIENDGHKNVKTDLDNLSSIFGTNSNDNKAIDDAMDILKNAVPMQSILDNFFNKKLGTNVFENTDVFN